MAISNDNVILRKASGTFAKQIVLRQRFGKTVLCKMPKPYPPKTPTQIANQERFKRANDFAKAAIKDPAKKAYYQSIAKQGQTAFNAAFRDAYRKPAVEATTDGKKVMVKVKGKHPVQKVKVVILNTAGKEKRNDFAVLRKNQWEYVLTHKTAGDIIRIYVHDIAGNICVSEVN